MRKSCICFLLKGRRVLLAPRRDGRGKGSHTGYGGGPLHRLEGMRFTCVREIREESGVRVKPKDLHHRACVIVYRRGVPRYELHIFTVRRWRGTPRPSVEMGMPRWHAFTSLPERMMPGEREWAARVFSGAMFLAHVYVDGDGKLERVTFTPAVFKRGSI